MRIATCIETRTSELINEKILRVCFHIWREESEVCDIFTEAGK